MKLSANQFSQKVVPCNLFLLLKQWDIAFFSERSTYKQERVRRQVYQLQYGVQTQAGQLLRRATNLQLHLQTGLLTSHDEEVGHDGFSVMIMQELYFQNVKIYVDGDSSMCLTLCKVPSLLCQRLIIRIAFRALCQSAQFSLANIFRYQFKYISLYESYPYITQLHKHYL